MTFEELLEKYQVLLLENGRLKEEITNLNTKLGVSEHRAIPVGRSDNLSVDSLFPTPNALLEVSEHVSAGKTLQSNISDTSDPKDKIELYMSLFKGRDDVYAKRWENKNKGTDGYVPCCLYEWKSGLCRKPKGKCAACSNKAYARLDEKVIDDHLRGRGNLVAGIYPLCLDETCCFLAIDFDDGEWQKDISQLREVCSEFDLPVAIERSRSGNGAHAWIFFASPIAATLARKLGSALLTYAMNKRHEITFKSYDRFFPNQDTMPRGGLGNLIALPLQKAARNENNSVFIDANFKPFDDQWGFMATIQKLSEAFVSVKLQGERAILELVKEYKGKVRQEFYPDRGDPKMRVAKVRDVISDLNKIAKETIWPLELMVFFAETAVQSIHEDGDIFEDMGDYFTDTYEEIIQRVNKEKTT